MKNEKLMSYLKKLALPLILLIAVYAIGRFTNLFGGFETMIVVSMETVIKVVVAAAFLLVLYYLLSIVLSFFTGKTGRIGTMATLVASISKYVMVLVAFCWIATIIGVDVSTIFASVGIVALILGFGAESLVADLVTGVFILFENEYNVGDIIEIDGYRGTVKEIGIRTLSLEDGGGNVKIINNSDLKNIINRSHHSSSAAVDIAVAYSTDLEAMDTLMPQILEEIREKHPDVFPNEIKYSGVETLGDYSITLRVVADVEEKNIFSGRRLLNKELKTAFDKHGVIMPCPQVDVHTVR